MMKKIAWITFIYGLIILIGGWMGHVKASSLASLVWGLIFGGLLLIAAWGAFRGKWIGVYGALLFTFLLDIFFTYRFIITQKWLPPGVMSLLSLLVLVLLAQWTRKASAAK